MNIPPPASVEAPHAPAAGLSLARSLDRGDVEAATACFIRDGCLITPDATAIHGRDRIRPLLAQLVSRRTEVEVELSSAIRGGDALLVHERWRVAFGGVESARVAQIWHPTLVLRQIEGDWRLAIAAPWGWGQTSS
jgi:ketosteroid isomerase-like protein